MTQDKMRRLPVLRRVRNPPTFRFLSDGRDAELLRKVYEYRFLTRPQIEQLAFKPGSESYAKRRLMLLYQSAYLARIALPLAHFGAPRILYALDTRGADFLAHTFKVDRKDLDWQPRDNRAESYFIDHLLATNDFRVRVDLSALQHGWQIDWIGERELRRLAKLARKTGGPRQPIPDGHFTLSGLPGDDPRREASFAVEVDRGNIDGKVWRRRIRSYIDWRQSGAYERSFGTHGLRVLIIAADVRRPPQNVERAKLLERRLDQLKRWTEEAGGRRLFWFTTSSTVWAGDPFEDPMWNAATGSELCTLISRAGAS